MTAIKEEAIKLINSIPDNENLTWDDIMYQFYIRQKIELGLKAAEEGHVISHEEMKKRFSPK
jgi:predicted transcriptional regulator